MKRYFLLLAAVSLWASPAQTPPAFGAGELGASGGDLFTVYDHWGNAIAVSNRYDGTQHYLHIASYNRNRYVNWERTHMDGYQERANSVALDPNGHVYIAGVRVFQGKKYLWAMKYSSAGDLLWEQADVYADCTAFSVAVNDGGESWLAGSCLMEGHHPVRVLRYSAAGSLLWGQLHYGNGRSYVRSLSVDFADRVSVTIEESPGAIGFGASAARTVVYDRQGGRVTTY